MTIRTMYALFLFILFTNPQAAAQDAPALKGFRGEFMGMFEHEAGKVVQLAGAVPDDKYSWRPAEGVRSISEVYMHVAGANILLPAMISGEKADFEALTAREKKVTDKKEVIAELTTSIENVKKLVLSMSDEDLEKSVTIPFIPMTTTARGILMMIMSHVSEHLGQSIAYARTNNIVPPWTAQSGGANE